MPKKSRARWIEECWYHRHVELGDRHDHRVRHTGHRQECYAVLGRWELGLGSSRPPSDSSSGMTGNSPCQQYRKSGVNSMNRQSFAAEERGVCVCKG